MLTIPFLFFISLLIVSCIELYAVKTSKQFIRYFSKPLLVPLILGIYYSGAGVINNYIVAGLLFGFAGDVFLLLPDKKKMFFISGLASFLAGHVCYIAAFIVSADCLRDMPAAYYLLLLPFAAFPVLYMRLRKALGSMAIPVFVYAGVIIMMIAVSAARGYITDGVQFWLPAGGSLLFAVSDSLLAYNKFKLHAEGSRVSIMATYILAQLLIAAGFMN